MAVELIADRRVTRYTCPTCQRCVEDGPEGVSVLYKGDQHASHRGGRARGLEQVVEQEQRPPLGSGRTVTLH
jgi:hypothetical protein